MFLCSCLQEIKLVYSWHPYKSSFILCELKLSSHQLKHMITNFCVIWLDVCCLSIKYWSLPLFSSYSLTELLQMYKKHWITDFTLCYTGKAAWTESKPLLTWEPPVCDVGCPQTQTAASRGIPAGCSRSGPALSDGSWTEELWTDNHSWSLTTCSPITWMKIEDVSLWGKVWGKII